MWSIVWISWACEDHFVSQSLKMLLRGSFLAGLAQMCPNILLQSSCHGNIGLFNDFSVIFFSWGGMIAKHICLLKKRIWCTCFNLFCVSCNQHRIKIIYTFHPFTLPTYVIKKCLLWKKLMKHLEERKLVWMVKNNPRNIKAQACHEPPVPGLQLTRLTRKKILEEGFLVRWPG